MNTSNNTTYLWIMAGGSIGAGLRYSLLILSSENVTMAPLTIFLENILGAFLLGLLTGLILSKKVKEWPWLHFAGTGVLGSFTTFSAFATDILYLLEQSPLIAVGYVAGSLLFGVLAAMAGLALTHKGEQK